MDYIMKPPWSFKQMLAEKVSVLFISITGVGIVWFAAHLLGFHIPHKWLVAAVFFGVLLKLPIIYLLKR